MGSMARLRTKMIENNPGHDEGKEFDRITEQTTMRLSEEEVKMMKEALTFLYEKIPKQTNKDVTMENVDMRSAFISNQSTMIQLQESLREVHLDSHGSKYRLAERRLRAQPFCTERQLDFIILHWVKDRRVEITLDDMVKVEAANEWIKKQLRLRDQKRKDREQP